MSRTIRRSSSMLLGALAMGLLAVPSAQAVQANGSITLIPSDSDFIVEGQEITVDVYFNNKSTLTPDPLNPSPPLPPPVPAVPAIPAPNRARVTGPITVELCKDGCDCLLNSTDLAFVPGPAMGCDAKGAGVTGCAASGASKVLINLDPGGLDIPDATPYYIATIRLRNLVMLPNALPRVDLQATIGMCALTSCKVPLPPPGPPGTDCAMCSAEGCTFVSGQTFPPPFSCKHGCPNVIEFFPQDPTKQDALKINFLVHQPGYDPATQPFRLIVSKGGVTIFDTGLQPGLPMVGNAFKLTGPGDNNTPGLEEIEVTRRNGTGIGGVDCTDGWFKIVVDARGDFSVAAMVDPTIKVEAQLDGQTYTFENQWTSVSIPAGIKKISFDIAQRSPC